MEQSGLKDERVAHIAGSERPGERPRPRLLGVSPPSRCGPRTKWPRKSGQSSFLCDRKENSSSQEIKQPNEFPAAPSRSLNLPKMRDDACDPSPDFLLQNFRFSLHSLLGRPCSISLLVGGPLAGIPVGGAGRHLVGVVGAPLLPVRRFVSMALIFRRRLRESRRWRRG